MRTAKKTVLVVLAVVIAGLSLYAQEGKKSDSNTSEEFKNLLAEGIAAADAGRLDEAETLFDKAIELLPGRYLPYYNRGNIYFDRGEYEQAIEAYSAAIERSEGFAAAYFNRGNANYQIGEMEAAAADYSRAVSITAENTGTAQSSEEPKLTLTDTEKAQALNNRGVISFSQGNTEDAELDFREALALDPDLGMARYNLGNIFYDREEYTEALEQYSHAIDEGGMSSSLTAKALFNRGNAYYRLGEYESASADYKEALNRDNDLEAAEFNMQLAEKQIQAAPQNEEAAASDNT